MTKLNKGKTKIYVLSPEISYKTFSMIWKLFPSKGITPKAMVKGHIIWEMIRDKQMIVYIDPLFDDNPIFTYELPKNKIVNIIK